jgi:hypothetical protein
MPTQLCTYLNDAILVIAYAILIPHALAGVQAKLTLTGFNPVEPL